MTNETLPKTRRRSPDEQATLDAMAEAAFDPDPDLWLRVISEVDLDVAFEIGLRQGKRWGGQR